MENEGIEKYNLDEIRKMCTREIKLEDVDHDRLAATYNDLKLEYEERFLLTVVGIRISETYWEFILFDNTGNSISKFHNKNYWLGLKEAYAHAINGTALRKEVYGNGDD